MQFPRLMFVYGTLQKGFCNAHYMKNCNHLGAARTSQKFGLFLESFPFISKKQSISNIHGELYEVLDITTLEAIDRLEGHPDEYTREAIEVILLENGNSYTAEAYFNENIPLGAENVVVITDGSYRDSPLSSTWKST